MNRLPGFSGALLAVLLAWGMVASTWAGPEDDFKAARAASARGNFDEAIRLYTRVLASAGVSPYHLALTYFSRGFLYGEKGLIDQAIEDYSQAINLRSDAKLAALVYHNRGNLYASKGLHALAIDDYTKSVELQPHSRPYFNRGFAYFYQGRFTEAETDFRASIRIKSDGAHLIYIILWLYLTQERLGKDGKKELAALTKDIHLDKWPGPLISVFQGDIKPQKLLDEMKSKDQHDQCDAFFYLGGYYLLRAKKEEAEKMLRLSISTCPETSMEYRGANLELKRLDLQ